MTDQRKPLPPGTVLDFQGLQCELGPEIGRGSNALVYRASYRDALDPGKRHHVLVKELYPLHPGGKIHRRADGSICVEEEGRETYEIHRKGFEAGNSAHLALLEAAPDRIGANINTCLLHGTLCTLLGVSGGESLEREEAARDIRQCVLRVMAILDALEVFHEKGILHLDVAPDNILLLGGRGQERAMLVDYDSLLSLDVCREGNAAVFSVKQGYTAPEVRSGRLRSIGFPADLYSVTAVFYRLLTGEALTPFQRIRPVPPDVSGCPCLREAPETVKAFVWEILLRGLQTLPARRYPDTASMRRDLEELLRRIDGVGISHWALWEAGRKQVKRMLRENPSLSFIRESARLYPSMVSDGTGTVSLEERMREKPENAMLLAGGGMGKTTALLRLCLTGEEKYREEQPAVMYLSLYGWRQGENTGILDRILDGLRFPPRTHTFEDARKALREVLDTEGSPRLLLLLDGLNETLSDPEPLVEEIRSLSRLRGLRILVSLRTGEASLPFQKLDLTELTEETVRTALEGEGLLLPESPGMQRMLRTPMMLSMYIQSGRMRETQVRAGSEAELMDAYLDSLREKAVRDLGEESGRRWQTEAALEMVLPALAREIHLRQPMDSRILLRQVEKCYRLLMSPLSSRLFPRWIGHRDAIRGGAENAEAWFAQVVHDLLWKRLGLLIRDDRGAYRICHALVERHLLEKNRRIRRRIRRSRALRIALCAAGAALVLGVTFPVIKGLVVPHPYREVYAEHVLEGAVRAYVMAGRQYEAMALLTESALRSPEAFRTGKEMYGISLTGGFSAGTAPESLEDMLGSGKVMPWSGLPMDGVRCRQLLELAEKRDQEYRKYADVLCFLMENEVRRQDYGDYPEKLLKLLETDACIASELYQIVVMPHLTGPYADHSVKDEAVDALVATVPRQNSHPSGGDLREAEKRLVSLEGARREAERELLACGAIAAFTAAEAGK